MLTKKSLLGLLPTSEALRRSSIFLILRPTPKLRGHYKYIFI